ncbi:unnamed protein product, partial [Rotaria sp. Silwood2]
LSYQGLCDQIDAVLSHISLNELSRLQTLTFTYIEKENFIHLKSMLPLTINL